MSDAPVTRFSRLIGLEAEPLAPGGARVTLAAIEPKHRNGNGVAHGSVLHALLDTAMGIEAREARKCARIATVEISVRFLVPVHDGPLVARGKALRVGKRLVFVEGQLRRGGDDGELVATAQGTFTVVSEQGPGPEESWRRD